MPPVLELGFWDPFNAEIQRCPIHRRGTRTSDPLPAATYIAPVEDDAPVVNGQEPIIPVSVPDPQLQAPTQANLQSSTPDPAIADLNQIPIETIDPTSTAQILEIIPNVKPTQLLNSSTRAFDSS